LEAFGKERASTSVSVKEEKKSEIKKKKTPFFVEAKANV